MEAWERCNEVTMAFWVGIAKALYNPARKGVLELHGCLYGADFVEQYESGSWRGNPKKIVHSRREDWRSKFRTISLCI